MLFTIRSTFISLHINAHICQWAIFTTKFNVSVCKLHGNMLGFVIVFLVPRALAFMCWKGDSCHYPHTKPLGVSFLNISTKDIFPLSCVRVCSLTDGCIGVTLEPLEAMCHLYGESSSFGWTKDPGTSLWLFQASGVPCIKVRRMAMYSKSHNLCVQLHLLCYIVSVSSVRIPLPGKKLWMT